MANVGFQAMQPAISLMLDCVTSSALFPATLLLVADGHDFAAALGSQTVSDIAADEANPTGYARQAVAFAGGVTIVDGKAVITWTDTPFGNLGGALDQTLGGAYMFANTGDDLTSPLFYSIQFDPQPKTDGSAFTVRWTSPTTNVAP